MYYLAAAMRVEILTAAVAAAVAFLPMSQQGQGQSFRASVHTVPLYPLVSGADGRLVTNLTRDDFIVLDNGKPAEITVFSSETQPMTAALLLEGAVDHIRTRAALAAVEGAGAGPRDWIVESVRHVAVPARRLAALERAGIRWCALEPVELLAVCAGAALARSVRNQPWLPAGTPVWITPPQRIR